MDTRTQPSADRVYEDFEPYYEWDKDEGRFTVLLPGYRRDQLKVQVTSKPALKLMGERLIFGNRWRRFDLEFPIPSAYDTDKVTATFEGSSLSVKFAKLIEPKETTNPPPPPEEAPKPKEPSQKVDEQKATQEDAPKAKEDKAEARTNEVSDQKTPQKEEPMDETEKSKTETAASTDKVAKEARTNGSTETTEAAISKAPKTKDAKSVKRSKTRLIDFTRGFEPFNQVEDEALGDSAAGLHKWKKLVIWVMLILLVVGLGLYGRNAFRSFQGEWNFLEQELLFPY